MRERAELLMALTMLIVLALFAAGYAATSSGSTTVQAVVPDAITITVPSSNSLSVSIDSTTTTNLSISVKSNTTWAMTAQKGGDLSSGSDSIPSARLAYTSSVTGAHGTGVSSATQFSLTSSNIVTGGSATGDAGDTVVVAYQLKATYDDSPGTYTASHTYTAAAP